MHGRTLSSVIYSVDARSNPLPDCDNQECLQMQPILPLWGEIIPGLEPLILRIIIRIGEMELSQVAQWYGICLSMQETQV